MVDPEVVSARLARLEACLRRLEAIAAEGRDRFLAEHALSDRAERNLQVALQVCIDLAAHVIADRGLPAPTGYGAAFRTLADEGLLDPPLAGRLGLAAGMRNILVHGYLDVDTELVFAALSKLDDLRAFARVIAALD